MEQTYLCIDLKSFYASVECIERNLDPLTTNLVVADESRTEKTICLAVTPSLKAYGIPGRARLFEVIQTVKNVNASRRNKAPNRRFTEKSYDALQLKANPPLELDYIIAKPRIAHYMEHSAKIYEIYLKYNDILNMQYPNPEIEKDFPDKILREAQFAPFAVLTGYDDTIAETARQTDSKLELDEYEIEKLNAKLQYLENADEEYKVVISYFVSDKKKSGGAYVSKSGVIVKVHEYEREVVMDDGTKIPIDDIYSISGSVFDRTEEI